MVIRTRALGVLVLLVVAALALAGCGADEGPPPAVTVAPIVIEPTPEASAEAPPPPPGQAVETATPTAVATRVVTATPRPTGPPKSGYWIDVDVSSYTVSLMSGTSATQVIGPVGVGREVDTGIYESTATGLYHVYSMDASLTYDAPYDTYISHWVGFDPALANGFHSFLKDGAGNVVDASTGRVSNGCIRTGAAEAIYAFAEIGMPVWVHF